VEERGGGGSLLFPWEKTKGQKWGETGGENRGKKKKGLTPSILAKTKNM